MPDAPRHVTDRAPVCRRLRSKSMLMEVEAGPDGKTDLVDDGFVWCTHTMNCLGPDGKVAARDTCRPGRGCHER